MRGQHDIEQEIKAVAVARSVLKDQLDREPTVTLRAVYAERLVAKDRHLQGLLRDRDSMMEEACR